MTLTVTGSSDFAECRAGHPRYPQRRKPIGRNRIVAELSRPIDNRIVGGVCAGIARRFGWSVGLVRLLTVLSIFIPGPQVIAYIVLWIVIPSERRG